MPKHVCRFRSSFRTRCMGRKSNIAACQASPAHMIHLNLPGAAFGLIIPLVSGCFAREREMCTVTSCSSAHHKFRLFTIKDVQKRLRLALLRECLQSISSLTAPQRFVASFVAFAGCDRFCEEAEYVPSCNFCIRGLYACILHRWL